MIEVFKITHNVYDRTVSPDLPLNERANTRGNHYNNNNNNNDRLTAFDPGQPG